MSTAQKKTPAQKTAACAQGQPAKLVADYPISSVLLVFGVGLGAGVAVASLLSGPAPPRPTLGRRTEQAAEQLGRQMLDAIAGVLPESLAKRVSG
ncbi:MAG: hypothetical protein EA381_04585 [Planctomycetaceae bacterium]|nr:MAG: hypothetical protein EA381_04585 [Planctomycetaceae bacterium]